MFLYDGRPAPEGATAKGRGCFYSENGGAVQSQCDMDPASSMCALKYRACGDSTADFVLLGGQVARKNIAIDISPDEKNLEERFHYNRPSNPHSKSVIDRYMRAVGQVNLGGEFNKNMNMYSDDNEIMIQDPSRPNLPSSKIPVYMNPHDYVQVQKGLDGCPAGVKAKDCKPTSAKVRSVLDSLSANEKSTLKKYFSMKGKDALKNRAQERRRVEKKYGPEMEKGEKTLSQLMNVFQYSGLDMPQRGNTEGDLLRRAQHGDFNEAYELAMDNTRCSTNGILNQFPASEKRTLQKNAGQLKYMVDSCKAEQKQARAKLNSPAFTPKVMAAVKQSYEHEQAPYKPAKRLPRAADAAYIQPAAYKLDDMDTALPFEFDLGRSLELSAGQYADSKNSAPMF